MRTLTKYTPAAGSEARSRPRALLLCLNTQGRLIIMNYGNTTGTSVSLLVANSTTLRRAVSSAAHKFHFFARSSDFDTGVQVDSEISFLSFARKSASATPTFAPRNGGVQLAVFAELRRFPDLQRNRIFGLFRYLHSIYSFTKEHTEKAR